MNNPLSFVSEFFRMALSWLPPAPLAVLGVALVILIGLAIWRCVQ